MQDVRDVKDIQDVCDVKDNKEFNGKIYIIFFTLNCMTLSQSIYTAKNREVITELPRDSFLRKHVEALDDESLFQKLVSRNIIMDVAYNDSARCIVWQLNPQVIHLLDS